MTIESRVAKLESQNRFLKVVGTALLGVVLYGVLGGQARKPGAVTATRFVLVDAAGKELAVLGKNGRNYGLTVVGSVREAAFFGLSGAADQPPEPTLSLLWMGGYHLHANAGQANSSLSLQKIEHGREGSVELTVSEFGPTATVHGGYAGRQRIHLAAVRDADGSLFGPALTAHDGRGKTRATLATSSNGEPSLELRDRDGEVRAVLGVTHTVDTVTGNRTSTGEGTLTVFGPDGKVIWQAPR